jgi:hypothetical protein
MRFGISSLSRAPDEVVVRIVIHPSMFLDHLRADLAAIRQCVSCQRHSRTII